MRLGELIAIARECNGLTLRQLANKTGMSHSNLAHIETGYVKEPSWQSVVKIARVLGLKLDRLAECGDSLPVPPSKKEGKG